MNGKYLIVGAIVGGIVLFLWGAVTHAVLPAPMHAFTNEDAVTQAIRTNTAGNGVYFAKSGILASVAFLPDYGDKTLNITLEPVAEGTRLVLEHTGFRGFKARLVSRIMGRGWKGIVANKIPAVVARMDGMNVTPGPPLCDDRKEG